MRVYSERGLSEAGGVKASGVTVRWQLAQTTGASAQREAAGFLAKLSVSNGNKMRRQKDRPGKALGVADPWEVPKGGV